MKLRRSLALATAATALATVSGIGTANAGVTLIGGGSTFVSNLIEACRPAYQQSSSANPNGDTLSYAATGSGTGKTNFANGTYQFGASDSLYSSGAPSDLVYIPLTAGPIAIAYHLDGVQPANANIRLTPTIIAQIFAGQITKWNDPDIVNVNKQQTVAPKPRVSTQGFTLSVSKSGKKATVKVVANSKAAAKYKGKKLTVTRELGTRKSTVKSVTLRSSQTFIATYAKDVVFTAKVGNLTIGSVNLDATVTGVAITIPDTNIKVAYRSGTSGTTNNFTLYLNKTVPSIWNKPANDAFTSAFPGSIPTNGTFQAASGNDGVANYVKDNNGAITYAELSFVAERASSGVKSAAVQNPAGRFIVPTSDSSAAFYANAPVDSAGVVTPDYAITDASAYTINAIAYGLGKTTTSTNMTAAKSFYKYIIETCAPAVAASKGYAPLVGAIKDKALAQVAKVSSS